LRIRCRELYEYSHWDEAIAAADSVDGVCRQPERRHVLVATALMLLGLLAGIVAAQLGGLRLGGVIVVPLIAVYLLRSFGSFPVFVVSILAAYVSVWVITDRLLVYGRRLFLVTVLVGSLVPVTMFEVLSVGLGVGTEVEFVGSILPGIAAYNFHRMDADRRVLDAVWAMALLLFLVVVGIGLVIAVGLSPYAGTFPPVLLGPESDIARAFDLTVARRPIPVIASERVALGLVVLGAALSEAVRSRYGLRLGGVIVVPVVVFAAFRNQWMLGLWVASAAVSYVGVWAVHRRTLLYGRVLLSLAVVFGLVTTASLVSSVPTRHGLLPFFVAILGGVTAYNVHVVPPRERPETVALVAGAFVVVAAVARLVVVPPAGGALFVVTARHVAFGAAVLAPTLLVVYRHERLRARPVGPGRAAPTPPAERPESDD
jgi:hypothetical protein